MIYNDDHKLLWCWAKEIELSIVIKGETVSNDIKKGLIDAYC